MQHDSFFPVLWKFLLKKSITGMYLIMEQVVMLNSSHDMATDYIMPIWW